MAWWMVLVWVVGSVISQFFRPKPDRPTDDDITIPTVEEGRPIPKVWGTVLLEGPMVAWWGDLATYEVKASTGNWFWNEPVVIGFHYYAGVHLIFCSGLVDEILEVRFGDKIATPTSTVVGTHRTEYHFNQRGLFGGDQKEGGISGDLYVYRGTTTQTADDYLEAKIGQAISGYRRLCHAVIRRMYLGTSPTLKPLALVVRACPNPLALTSGRHNIAGDANPANILVDLLTADHASNGLGISLGVLDTTALVDVGNTLAGEGLGMSLPIYQAQAGSEVVADTLRHIDAALFIEPTTGLLRVELVRNDYDPNTLLELNPDNFVLGSFSRPGWEELRNTVRVQFVDKEDGFRKKVASAQDLASLTIRGGEVAVEDIPMRGLSTSQNGQKGAARALATLSYPLAAVSGVADRSAWTLRPGRPVKLTWPPLGISGLVCRVTQMGEGRLDDGKISLVLVEDIFGIDWTAYTPPPVSTWTDPLDVVPSLLDQVALNAPYELVKHMSPGPDIQARALVMAARGAGVVSGLNLYVRAPNLSWPPATEVRLLSPSGTLSAAIMETSTTIVINAGASTDLLQPVSDADFSAGVNVLWIDDEFVAFKTVTQGSGIVTLGGCVRGCLDTVPQAHAAGARVWFPSYGSHVQNINTPSSGNLDSTLRFQAFNTKQSVPFASAPDEVVTATTPNRAARPLVPCAVLIVGYPYPTTIGAGQSFAIYWTHRNRLASWRWSNAGATAAQEPSATYTIKVWGEIGTLVHTETGITGTSWTYVQATEIAESGLGRLNNHLRVQLFAVLGSATSWQTFEWEVDRV